jgi:GNAT superfamily N-acetyltransferase
MNITRVHNSKKLDEIEYKLIHDDNYNFKGEKSSLSHLKSSLCEWRVEQNWCKGNDCFVFTMENKGYIFFNFTKREPKHCTLRHIFVLEEYRNQKIAFYLFDKMIDIAKKVKVNTLRMFAVKSAIQFYEKKNIIKYHGYSKTKMPFYYGDFYGNLKPLPPKQIKYVHTKTEYYESQQSSSLPFIK